MLSRVTPCFTGTGGTLAYWTHDTTNVGVPCLGSCESLDKLGVQRVVDRTVEAVRIFEYNYAKTGLLLIFEIPFMSPTLYLALDAQRIVTPGATYPGSFTFDELSDISPVTERTETFTALRWVSLTYDRKARIGDTGYLRNVRAELVSTAAT